MSKDEIKKWSNSKGEGQLFSVTFGDESGEIRATGFTNVVDLFYDMLVVDQVYIISKAQIKAANKRYSSNDYEMTLDPSTDISLVFFSLTSAKMDLAFLVLNIILRLYRNYMISKVALQLTCLLSSKKMVLL